MTKNDRNIDLKDKYIPRDVKFGDKMPHSQKVSKIGYSSCFIFNTQNVLEPQKLIDRLFYIELLLSFHMNYLQIRGDQLPVTKRSMEPVQFTCEFLS